MTENGKRNAEIVRLRKRGLQYSDIAKRLRVSRSVVAGVLHRAGETTLPKGRGHGATEKFKNLVRADRAAGLSYSRLADRWGITKETASEWCQ